MHVHPECGDLQTAQADDAILGASDSDVIHCEEPVTVGIRQYEVKSVVCQSGGIRTVNLDLFPLHAAHSKLMG